jgi:hypothetical protein
MEITRDTQLAYIRCEITKRIGLLNRENLTGVRLMVTSMQNAFMLTEEEAQAFYDTLSNVEGYIDMVELNDITEREYYGA